uniref:Uncharacterized protein n=1 Tax=viral metagenome TaxID=1070528 RepID=A0A6C0B8L2_9ZZZZ
MSCISESIPLKSLIDESEYVNNTESIRKLKHSTKIRDDVRRLDTFKSQNNDLFKNNIERFLELAIEQAPFLYNNYMDLFHKMVKDELDLTIMTKLLIVLKMIEDGSVDQYKGSVMVGKVLKELYIDSAVKRGDNLDKEHEEEKPKFIEGQSISWKQYKKNYI